jgi:surface protein
MRSMFNDCKELISLDLSKFNTKFVKDMAFFLSGCIKLEYADTSNFDGSSITSVNYMFKSCKNIGKFTIRLNIFLQSQINNLFYPTREIRYFVQKLI